MKVIKKLDDYIAVKVADKIPVADSRAEEQRIRLIIEDLEKEFRNTLRELKLKFQNDAEAKYPELKDVSRDIGYCIDLYNVYGSAFAKRASELERKSYNIRQAVHKRIVLQIELSEKNLTLDEIDAVIAVELANVIAPAVDTVSANKAIEEKDV